MALHIALFVIDCLAVFSILLVGAGILKSSPRAASARIFAIIAFNTACYQIWSRAAYSQWIPPELHYNLGAVALPMQVLLNSTPGLFMYLCFVLFQENAKFPRWLSALFVLQIALSIAQTTVGFDAIRTGPWVENIALRDFPAILELAFSCAGLYWTAKDWRADLVERRRQLRLVFVLVIGIMTFGITLLEGLLVPANTITQFYVHESATALSVVLNSTFIVLLFNENKLLQSDLGGTAQVATQTPEDAPNVTDRDFEIFERAFREQRLYREPGLTIASLAHKLSVPEYRLRRLINAKLGYRNFNAMLNRYRIDDATKELADPAQRGVPILTIALTMGYQSINPFNRAFRELKGTTPTEFRRQSHAKT